MQDTAHSLALLWLRVQFITRLIAELGLRSRSTCSESNDVAHKIRELLRPPLVGPRLDALEAGVAHLCSEAFVLSHRSHGFEKGFRVGRFEIIPVWPSTTRSRMHPAADVVITGSPADIASSTTCPYGSPSVGNTKTSAAPKA